MPRLIATFLSLILLTAGPDGTREEYQSRKTPLDPQRVQDQEDMTWNDYRPIPRKNWANPSLRPERALRVALVAIDFEDLSRDRGQVGSEGVADS
jgi:hypothetical protein